MCKKNIARTEQQIHNYFMVVAFSPLSYSIVVRFPITFDFNISCSSLFSSYFNCFPPFLLPSLTEQGHSGILLCMKLPNTFYLQRFLFSRMREVSLPYYGFH